MGNLFEVNIWKHHFNIKLHSFISHRHPKGLGRCRSSTGEKFAGNELGLFVLLLVMI